MPQLDPSSYTSQFFWLIVSFSCLYFLMSVFIIPRIADTINKRQKLIDGHINSANKSKNRADKIFEDYENTINSAHSNALASYEKALSELNEFVNQKKLSLQKELAKITEEAQMSVEKDKKIALEKIDSTAGDLALNIMEKIGLNGISKAEIEKTIKNMNN